MNKKRIIFITAALTAIVTAILSAGLTLFINNNIMVYMPSANVDKTFFNKIRAVDSILDTKYLYDYNEDTARNAAIKAYVDAIGEPYTEYYSPDEFLSYMGNIQDGYVGIGIMVSADENNRIVVIAPFEDSPAYKAGIQPSDIILSIDGKEYSGENMSEAVASIKNGREGTAVLLKIQRGDSILDVEVTRGDISSQSVKGGMLEDNIGYIRITGFNMASENAAHSTSSEFSDKLNELQTSGMEKLIIDLRDNPGGVLTEVCDIADMLLGEGTIVYTEEKNGKRKYYNSDANKIDIPITVLINENSASASEVLTGALKDYGRATVVGVTSYGKGIVQEVIPFADGSGMSFTTAKYYTPNGICIHEIGIEPDVVVELPENIRNTVVSSLDMADDTQLQKALEIIRGK